MNPPEFEGWLAHGWGIQVETPEELFRVISRVALSHEEKTYAWRGQNDASWALSSSLFREIQKDGVPVTESAIRDREEEILKQSRRWGLGRDLGASATDLHMLSVLQHHGVPTRLVDVTANPMTALWFATEERNSDDNGPVHGAGVLFAIDVTKTAWSATFEHGMQTWDGVGDSRGAAYEQMLEESAGTGKMFRVFPALPDDRMKAQEGYFLGSAVPEHHVAPGLLGINPLGTTPGPGTLRTLLANEKDEGTPDGLPFCAIVIPAAVKERIRGPLKRTYNRRRRVLFPDVDGFRVGRVRRQLD